jgi:hypothetical protein
MNQTVLFVFVGVFIAWRMYIRMRRSIGRQMLKPRRTIARIVVFAIASVFTIGKGLQAPRLLLGFGGGLLAGTILGFVGLRLTRFETTEEGHFYTPDTRIGIALSLLLTGRLIYRIIILNDVSWSLGHPPAWQSPLTFFIAGLTFGYYLVYYIGLFVHTHDKKPPEKI